MNDRPAWDLIPCLSDSKTHSLLLFPYYPREKKEKKAMFVSKNPIRGFTGSVTLPTAKHVGVGIQE